MELKERNLSAWLLNSRRLDALLHAAEHVRDAGYKKRRRLRTFSGAWADRSHGLSPKPSVPFIVLMRRHHRRTVRLFHAVLRQQVLSYPIIIAGRPAVTAGPTIIPISYECTILFAAFSAVLWHAGIERFTPAVSSAVQRPQLSSMASRDRFFIVHRKASIQSSTLEETRKFLEGLEPVEVIRGARVSDIDVTTSFSFLAACL